ncbi:MAG TPA: L-threonylcarbamoyladenylate synthase [Casimicrobiaceae bacterium]|jgi:L-threonylcarbamoyladenylate synthase|nr:L-threonylcarbamoyladenylate synthase [Casimicrobiaceae bacterium]
MPNAAIRDPDPAAIAEAATRLAGGELVAFPTETVYGLGANAEDAAAVRRLYAAKGRPAAHPVIVHVADAASIGRWARDVPDGARRLAEAFWPGPLTLILPRAQGVDDVVTGGQDSVGLRVPSHPVARALLAAFRDRGGHGIAAPSANRFGHVSATTAQHVADDFGDAVAMILDGGAAPVGIESTIVAFRDGVPMLLRPGGIASAAIEAALGERLHARDDHAPRASGTLASHYAPRTRARLVAAHALAAEIAQHAERDEAVAVLARTAPCPAEFDGRWIAAPADAEGYARTLYAALRELDAAHADAILIEAVPDAPPWQAVRDRLARATR